MVEQMKAVMEPATSAATEVVAQPRIEVRHLTKRFARRSGGGDVVPVDDVSLDVVLGELLVLLGPSGCGKSTLLRCIAGLEHPDEGEIRIDGEVVFSSERKVFVPPNKRPISMIFQSYALWPHMTVFENVAYPLRSRRVPKEQIASRVERALDMVGLGHLARQYPGQVSGGQQQRIALARAVVGDASVILFDEPLSNVDAKVREQLRLELAALQRSLGFTSVYVTHDQTEAMELADRIAVLQTGRVAQLAAPTEIYERPSSRYVAEFIGTTNLISGRANLVGDGQVEIQTGFGTVVAPSPAGAAPERGSEVTAMSRPQHARLSTRPPTDGVNAWQGTVRYAKFVGTYTQYVVELGATPVQVWSTERDGPGEGDETWVSIRPGDLSLVRETADRA